MPGLAPRQTVQGMLTSHESSHCRKEQSAWHDWHGIFPLELSMGVTLVMVSACTGTQGLSYKAKENVLQNIQTVDRLQILLGHRSPHGEGSWEAKGSTMAMVSARTRMQDVRCRARERSAPWRWCLQAQECMMGGAEQRKGQHHGAHESSDSLPLTLRNRANRPGGGQHLRMLGSEGP